MKVKISEIKRLTNRLRKINAQPLHDIEFLDNKGNKIEIDPKNLNDFHYTGLNNTDFITTDFYKDGYTQVSYSG